MRRSLLYIPLALAIWALVASIAVTLKRQAAQGALPVLHWPDAAR
jgi:hypothetical protein